jgi:4-alpha-glucanotransferase
LGTITPDVRALMHRFGLPGMRVLLFAFGDGDSANIYLPHNHVRNCVVYTGTHDNNTVRGWFEHEASLKEKQMLSAYVGKRMKARDVHEAFLNMAMGSVANTAIIPMQDILGLSGKARMNRPATIRGNWQWRLIRGQLTGSIATKLGAMTMRYGRG